MAAKAFLTLIAVKLFYPTVDTPDPYVKLRVPISPNAMQRTKPIPNEKNPKWNSEFKFFLDPEAKGERKLGNGTAITY